VWWLNGISSPAEARQQFDLEEIVAEWVARQQPMSWVFSSIVLSLLLMAIVLFALGHPA